nr:hypothetical protein [Microctonus hyperodae filamentous virus]
MILLQKEKVLARRDNDTFIQLTFFDDKSLLVHEGSGFFNATKLCKNVNKRLANYTQLEKYHELEKHFTLLFGTVVTFGTREFKYNDAEIYSGTYMHPVLLLAVAMWCSPRMYVEAALVIIDYFNNGGEARKQEMKEKLLPRNFDPSHIQESTTEVTYAGCQLLMDPVTRWFNASKFCAKNGKRLDHFERYENAKETLTYLTNLLKKNVSYKKGLNKTKADYGTYYHPIMFVRLASWLSVDFYLRAAVITWNHLFDDNNQKTVQDTTTTTTMLEVEDVREMLLQPDKKIDEVEPSSMPMETAVGGIIWDEDDDWTCSTSCMDVDESEDMPENVIHTKLYTEEEMECIRREYEIKVDRSLRSQVKAQKEKERVEQEKQKEISRLHEEKERVEQEKQKEILRLHEEKERVEQEKKHIEQEKKHIEQEKKHIEQEKQEEIARLHEERRIREDELEELRARLEDLQLEYQRERVATSNEVQAAENIRTQSILCCAEQHGIQRLESVLLVRMRVIDPETKAETLQIYAFRRQFFSLVATVGEHLPNIVEFLCWFVTDNSVQDFNRCKDRIRGNNQGKNLKLTQNTISLTKSKQPQATILADVVETARKVMQLSGLVEADVGVFQRLFTGGAQQPEEPAADSSEDPRVRAVLQRAYRWVYEAYKEYTAKGRRALARGGRHCGRRRQRC